MVERVERITRMEERMDIALSLLQDARQTGVLSPALAEAVAVLDGYYASPLWMEDYQADEKGLLPTGLKRGVLSQDGLWNLLSDYSELIRKTE